MVHPADPKQREPGVPGLVLLGLGAQLLGVVVQAVFHLAGPSVAPVLTEARAFLIDHVVSNVGVVCLAGQVGRWAFARVVWSNPARRLMVVGTCLQVAGALADGVGHLVGGEQPAAFAGLGVGYLLVAAGAVLARRPRRNPRPGRARARASP